MQHERYAAGRLLTPGGLSRLGYNSSMSVQPDAPAPGPVGQEQKLRLIRVKRKRGSEAPDDLGEAGGGSGLLIEAAVQAELGEGGQALAPPLEHHLPSPAASLIITCSRGGTWKARQHQSG